MAIPEFHFGTCANCDREIMRHKSSRTGWVHYRAGILCYPDVVAHPKASDEDVLR